ncbi:hypothetical protein JKF63_07395 [Porcisia hertigi]|uniref:Uncharacterized protein n=1 Tax=Porcisia hertigi TaxID=2761500 RepID=A0A836LKV8_9TRYP|nr:hypothetical protein JKF63_07395 [Porcisia hertigi]
MEEDTGDCTASINFSVASSSVGDSDEYVHHPKPTRPSPPTLQPLPLRAAPPLSSSSSFSRSRQASVDGAPLPATSLSPGSDSKSIALNQANVLLDASNDVNVTFLRALQRLDSADPETTRFNSDEEDRSDDDVVDEGKRTALVTRALEKLPATDALPPQSTASSRERRVSPPRQHVSANNMTATTTVTTSDSTIHFAEEDNKSVDAEMVGAAVDAAPESGRVAVGGPAQVLHAVRSPKKPLMKTGIETDGGNRGGPSNTIAKQQQEHQDTAVMLSSKPLYTPQAARPQSTTTATRASTGGAAWSSQPLKSLSAQTSSKQRRRLSRLTSRNVSLGCMVSPDTAATITLSTTGVGDAAPRRASPTTEKDEDAVNVTVSETTMANTTSLRGGTSPPPSAVSAGLQENKSASGGPRHLSGVHSSQLLLDAEGQRVKFADVTLDVSRGAAVAGVGDTTFEDYAGPVSQSSASLSMVDRRGKPLSTLVQRMAVNQKASAPAPVGVAPSCKPTAPLRQPRPSLTASELKGHSRGEREREVAHSLGPSSSQSPRKKQSRAEAAHRRSSSASSILGSLFKRAMCGVCMTSVASKSSCDPDGRGSTAAHPRRRSRTVGGSGGEGREEETNVRNSTTTSTTTTTRITGVAHGSAKPAKLRANTTAALAEASPPLTPRIDPMPTDTRPIPPPPIAAAASVTAGNSKSVSASRERESSPDNSTINFYTDDERDRGCSTGSVGVATASSLTLPAATAAEGPVEVSKGNSRAERRRHRRSSLGDGGGDKIKGGSPSVTPSTSVASAEKLRHQLRKEERQNQRRKHRHRRERPEEPKKDNGVSRYPRGRSRSPTPPLESQPPDRSARSDAQSDHGSRHRSPQSQRQYHGNSICERALRGDGRSPGGGPKASSPVNGDWSGCRDNVMPRLATTPAADLVARRSELRAKSRAASSVNHFALSWHTRHRQKRQQQQQRRASHECPVRLQERDGERKESSEKATVLAAVASAASRSASWQRPSTRGQRSAVRGGGACPTDVTPSSLRQTTAARLEKYEENLKRDLAVLDAIVEKRRRRELWAEASPEAVAAAVAAEAEAEAAAVASPEAQATPSRRSSRAVREGIRPATALTAGPLPSRVRTGVDERRSGAKPVVGSSADDGSQAGALAAPRAQRRGSTSPLPLSTSPGFGTWATAGTCQQQQQQLRTSAPSTLLAASTADSTLSDGQESNAADNDPDNAREEAHNSGSIQPPGVAAPLAIDTLLHRYEQLLEDLAARPAPTPPETSEGDDGTAQDGEYFVKVVRSRHDRGVRRREFSRPHIADVVEAEVARCAAALKTEYYQTQQQGPPKTREQGGGLPLLLAAPRGGADAVSVADVAASYAQALRPSCVSCRPQHLSEYVTLGLLSMIHDGRGEWADIATREKVVSVPQGGDTKPFGTLVQRPIREDLYAPPRRGTRRRMEHAEKKRRSTYADEAAVDEAPPIASVSGTILSSVQPPLCGEAAAVDRDVGLSLETQAAHPPMTQPPPSITHPTSADINSSEFCGRRLMRHERHARHVLESQEREAMNALQLLYIVKTILFLRGMREAAEKQEREVLMHPQKRRLQHQNTFKSRQSTSRTNHTISGALAASANDTGGKPCSSAVLSDERVALSSSAVSNSGAGEERGTYTSDSMCIITSPRKLSIGSVAMRSEPGLQIAEDALAVQITSLGNPHTAPEVATDAERTMSPEKSSMASAESLLFLAEAEATLSPCAQQDDHRSRSPPSAARSSCDAKVEEGAGAGAPAAAVVPLASMVLPIQKSSTPEVLSVEGARRSFSATDVAKNTVLEERTGKEQEGAGGGGDGVVVVVGGGAATSLFGAYDHTPRLPPDNASEVRSQVEADAVERYVHDGSPLLSHPPSAPMAPPPKLAAAVDVDDAAVLDRGDRVDLDVARLRNGSAPSLKCPFRVEGVAHQNENDAHGSVVVSSSSIVAVPAAVQRPSALAAARPLTSRMHTLTPVCFALPQAAEAQHPPMDSFESFTDSSHHRNVDDRDDTAAAAAAAAARPPSTAGQTTTTPRRPPPPVSPSLSVPAAAAAAAVVVFTPTSSSSDVSFVDDAGEVAPTVLVLQGTGISREQGEGEEKHQGKSTTFKGDGKVDSAPSAANATQALNEAPRQPPVEGLLLQPMSATTATLVRSAPCRRVCFSLPPEIARDDDCEDDEQQERSQPRRGEVGGTPQAASIHQPMARDHRDDAAPVAVAQQQQDVGDNQGVVNSADVVASSLLEKLESLDTMLLCKFPSSFTPGTGEDGLPEAVIRRHRLAQPLELASSQQWADVTMPFVDGHESTTLRAAAAAARAEAGSSPPYTTTTTAAAAAAAAATARANFMPPQLPPESFASQLRRKYGLPRPQQQTPHSMS